MKIILSNFSSQLFTAKRLTDAHTWIPQAFVLQYQWQCINEVTKTAWTQNSTTSKSGINIFLLSFLQTESCHWISIKLSTHRASFDLLEQPTPDNNVKSSLFQAPR